MKIGLPIKQYAYNFTRTELYPRSACTEVCLPLVLWTTWTIIPVQEHQNSFHGTGISMFQFPSLNKPGECRPPFTVPPSASGKHVQLPDIYTTFPAVSMAKSNTAVPEVLR